MHKVVRAGICHGFLNKNPNLAFFLRTSPLHYRAEKTLEPNLTTKLVANHVEKIPSRDSNNTITVTKSSDGRDFRSSHPLPEWVDLIECLGKRGYFNGEGNPLAIKKSNAIRTACLYFARQQSRLIKSLTRKDIYAVVACGCPSTDRRVIISGKRLRALAGIDEESVCSSCNLRGWCTSAYIKAPDEKPAQTIDVIRILLMYGLDPVYSTVENSSCHNKQIKESVRRLLKEIVDYTETDLASKKGHPREKDDLNIPTRRSDWTWRQSDWICPKCYFLNFARNIRCLQCHNFAEERLRQLRADRENLLLKKGDWICESCNLFNFAKYTRCLICKDKPKLNPGEWECESCNYINFRKRTVCLRCNYRRPKPSNSANTSLNSKNSNGVKPVMKDSSSFKFVTNEDEVNKLKSSEQIHRHDCPTDDGVHKIFGFSITGGKISLSQDAKKKRDVKDKYARERN